MLIKGNRILEKTKRQEKKENDLSRGKSFTLENLGVILSKKKKKVFRLDFFKKKVIL